jgi:hypothetical protein
MPRAIVAGIPRAWAKQVRAALNKVDRSDWSFPIFPSRHPHGIVVDAGQISDLMQMASEQPGVHILAFDEGRGRAGIAQDLRSYFRFRWLPAEILRTVAASGEQFTSEIQRVLLEEDAWRGALHPIDKGSALTLPQYGFAADPAVANIWAMCEAYNKEAGFFESVSQRLQRFANLHLKKWDRHNQRFFIDNKSRVWKDDGPYHGETPFPGDWKYSSTLPKAFHYDVQHEHARAFEYIDRKNRRKSVAAAGHCNVDAHGYLRN